MVTALLSELAGRGVRILSATPSEVRVEGHLTDDLRAKLRQHKTELLAHFAGQQQAVTEGVETLASALALGEIARLPVALLSSLPRATSLVLAVPGIESPIVFTSSRAAYANAQAKGWPAFSPSEYEVLALACQNSRAFEAEFRQWCQRKQRHPNWTLSEAATVAGLQHPDRGQDWTFARPFRHLGVQLQLIELDAAPASPVRGVCREANGSVWRETDDGREMRRGPGGDA